MAMAKIGYQNNLALIKQALGHVVESRAGYQLDLKPYGKKIVEEFQSVGFINSGRTLKADTYSVTQLGDLYYKDVFGFFSYAYRRIKGFWKRCI